MSDQFWTPPDVKEMLGEWWDQYARRNGITWSVGPKGKIDHCGNPYVTLIWSGVKDEAQLVPKFHGTLQELFDAFEKSLDALRGTNRHIVWRFMPHYLGNPGTIRARLTCYPHKP